MSKPLHTREFSLSDAREGAPISLACGWPVEIVRWNMRDGKCPILGLYGDQDQIGRWTAAGVFLGGGHSSLGLVMTPLGYLDGKPVFVGDEILNFARCLTRAFVGMALCEGSGWRWPAPPKVYPSTQLTGGELYDKYMSCNGDGYTSLDHVVNFALRHYIDNLTVLPDDCALRAKLVEMGWTPPDTSANWLERVTPANAKEGAR